MSLFWEVEDFAKNTEISENSDTFFGLTKCHYYERAQYLILENFGEIFKFWKSELLDNMIAR